MSTEKGAAIKGSAREGAYTETWRAANDILDPQTYGQLVRLYGEGLKAVDALMWRKSEINISTRTMEVIEEGHFWNTLTTAAQVNTQLTPGGNISVSSNDDIRVGFSVRIPASYITGALIAQDYRILSKTPGTPNVYVCEPFLSTQVLNVAVPTATQLMVGASSYAPGTQQPASTVNDYYSHNHYTRIMKETVDIEGGQVALKELDDMKNSQYGGNLRARAILLAQLKMRLQQNDFVLMGYPNTNSLAQNNRHGESNAISSDYGLIPAMAQATGAMKQYYTGAYGEDNLESVKYLLASQGMSGTNSVMAMLGQEIFTGISRSMRGFLREYSAGTNLYYNDLQKVGFGIRQIMLNNTTFNLLEVPEFSDPTRYAAPGLNFETMGLIFPDTKVTVTLNGKDPRSMSNAAGRKLSCDHINLGFLNYNGENRKMIVGNKAGVNGLGIPFSDDWDDSSTYLLTEMMNLLFALNQTIMVLRTH
jgi:hypothetical protein